MYISSGADASYIGLVATIQHRMSSSFVFLANYTWSHCIDISDNAADVSTVTVQNPANIQGDKGSCGFDFRDVFNSTLVASSHFSSLNRVMGSIVNHWEISPLVHTTDGAPFTVVSGQDYSLTATGNDRPNVTNPKNLYTHNKIVAPGTTGKFTTYLNANSQAFAANPTGTFGNSGRFAYRGPTFLQVDTALNRSFNVYRTLVMNLRFESFNLLNHPNFAAPGSSGYLGSSTSLLATTPGQITSTVNNYGARLFQGAMKFNF